MPSWNFFLFYTDFYEMAFMQNHVEYFVQLSVLFFTNMKTRPSILCIHVKIIGDSAVKKSVLLLNQTKYRNMF